MSEEEINPSKRERKKTSPNKVSPKKYVPQITKGERRRKIISNFIKRITFSKTIDDAIWHLIVVSLLLFFLFFISIIILLFINSMMGWNISNGEVKVKVWKVILLDIILVSIVIGLYKFFTSEEPV